MNSAAQATRSRAWPEISPDQALAIVREATPGIGVVLLLGFLANVLGQAVNGLDPLVAAVMLGMTVRQVVGAREAFLFKLLPGIIIAQAVLIPIGITLYGKNFDLKVLVDSHPAVILQVMTIAATTFVAMYFIGKRLGFKDNMLYMLGFGSAVCGASAIAVTASVTECEPDETATALVNNTLAVVFCLAGIAWFLRPLLGEMEYAALAGALLHQTGFVKMALAGAAKKAFTFGLAVKSLRIALLTISIPVVSYLVRRRIYLPWFLVTFVISGVLFSYVSIPQGASDAVVNVYNLCFASALASVGLNADIRRVGRNLFKPLVLILIVFAVDLGLFAATAQFISY